MATGLEIGGDEGDRTPDLLNAICHGSFLYLKYLQKNDYIHHFIPTQRDKCYSFDSIQNIKKCHFKK